MSGELERVTMLGKWRWLRTVMQSPGVSKAAMQVAGALAEYWNPEHGIAWPGQARLARECGCSERSIVKAVAWLEAHGFVAVIRRGRANAYAVCWDKAATIEGCSSASGKVKQRSPMKGEAEFTLSKSTGLNPSTEQNLLGTFAEGEPQRGPRVAASPTHYQPSPVDNCGRTAEQHEQPEPGFEDRPSWYASQEPDDDLPEPAYAPEPEPELPSRELERQFGGKPPAGSKVHGIWRLQRRLEGVCRKVGASPFAITDICGGEWLDDLLDRQAASDRSIGRDLAEYAGLDFQEKADFFERRGQC